MQENVGRPVGSERRYDLDWLRVFCVFLLVPYHTVMMFNSWGENFYVMNPEPSGSMSYFVRVVWPWFMPLLFLIAGASSWYTIKSRSGTGYVTERLKRLFIPLLFGLLVIVPPQSYIAMLSKPGFNDSYLQFYPGYFVPDPSDLSGVTGHLTPGHLWFILYLFVFALVALPLFSWLRGARGERLVAKLAAACRFPGVIFLAAIPLLLTQALPDLGGKNPFYFCFLFILGYLLMMNAGFYRAIERQYLAALVLGLCTTTIHVLLIHFGAKVADMSVGDILWGLLQCFNTIFWLVFFLGFGRRFLNFTNRVLLYTSEASYPFYILHQTVVVTAGYFVVQLNLNPYLKAFMIITLAYLGTFAVYELVVRHFNPVRFLFGMKPRRAGTVAGKSLLPQGQVD